MKALIILILVIISSRAMDITNYLTAAATYNKHYTNKQGKLETVLIKNDSNNLYVGDFILVKNSKYYSNTNLNQPYNSSTFLSIRQLSTEFRLNNVFSVTLGILPFNYGDINDNTELYSAKGNGIGGTTSINITGMFLAYKHDKFTNIIGYGVKDLLLNTDIKLSKNYPMSKGDTEYSLKGSKGIFIINKYNNKDNKIENDIYRIKFYINNKFYGNLNLFTLGYKYGNFNTNNNIYFAILELSKPDNGNKEYIKNKLGKSISLGISNFNNLYYFNKEVVSTFIVKRIYDNYINFSFGDPYTGYGYSDIGYNFIFSEKIFINSRLTMLFRYKYLTNNKVIKPNTLNYYETSNKKINNVLYFGLKYKF